jgi:hypothetical protein
MRQLSLCSRGQHARPAPAIRIRSLTLPRSVRGRSVEVITVAPQYLPKDSEVPRVKALSKTLLALYLLILLWLVLFKFSIDLSVIVDYQTRSVNLIPFADVSRHNLRETIYNFVVFIPFGVKSEVVCKLRSLVDHAYQAEWDIGAS